MRLARAAAALAFCLSPAVAQEDAVETGSLRERFEELTARTDTLAAEELGRALAGLGPDAAPLILAALGAQADDAALRAAVRALGRKAFLPMEGAEQPSPTAVLATVAEVGDARDLDLALHLEGAEDDDLERALRRVLERDERTWNALAGAALQAETRVIGCAIRAVGQSGDTRAVPWLGEMLAYGTGLDLVMLSQLQLTARNTPTADSVRFEVRRRLWAVDDDQVLRKAIEVSVTLDDDEALERLVELLTHENQQVVLAAQRALRTLSGLSLPGEPEAWERWLAEERQWFEKRSPAVFRELARQNRGSVIEAVRELARHRYQRRTLANELRPLVFHADVSVRRVTCEALRQLGVREAVPELRLALEDEDAGVAAAAREALVALDALPDEPAAPLVAELEGSARDDLPARPLR